MDELREGAPTAHVVTHHHEHTRQTRHRNVGRQGHGHEENDEQHQGVDDAGHAGGGVVVDVGHGAGDGSCGGDTAEEGGHDVGNALPHQFLIGVVVVARDAIGHGGREQALNRSEHGDDKGGGDEGVDGAHREAPLRISEKARPVDVESGDGRQGGGDLPEAVADGGDVGKSATVGQINHSGGDNDSHERTGEFTPHLWRKHNQHD